MFKNLTPHSITLIRESGENLVLESAGLARVSSQTEIIGEIEGIPLTRTVFGEVEGLPAPEPGVVYIVSSIVAQRVPERQDVVIVNQTVRDDAGRIIGCKSLAHV